jgi:L-arabinose isomerase
MIERKKKRTAEIAVFGVGHSTYWDQFDGLYDNLMKYHKEFIEKVKLNSVNIIDYGISDSDEKAYKIVNEMNKNKPDIVFCNMLTYATSSVFAPVIRNIGVPVILIALQPLQALDYSKACTFMQLENDNICSVPEFTGVAVRFGKKIDDVIIGYLYDDDKADKALSEWCEIAKVLNALKGARIGLMGHVLEAMYDMHTDPAAISAAFNIHVPLLEIDYLVEICSAVTQDEIKDKIKLIQKEFDMPDPVSDPITKKLTDKDLYQAAKTAAGLDKFVQKYKLDGLAYHYEGLEGSLTRGVASSLIVGNSILNAQGIPMCGEYDIKTCIAMYIMDNLDIGGSFAEFHPIDFKEDFILIGHDGPHHIKIAEGKPILRSLLKYHGKTGMGASVEFKIKEGPITMLGITQNEHGKFKFVIGEGWSKKGPIPPTGNSNTRGFFNSDTRDFIKRWVLEGPTHHYALGVGHHADTIQKIARVLNIESVIVR